MKDSPAVRRRPRLQLATLVIMLAASAAEVFALTAGMSGLRDALLALIAVTMVVAAAAG